MTRRSVENQGLPQIRLPALCGKPAIPQLAEQTELIVFVATRGSSERLSGHHDNLPPQKNE